MGILSRIGDAFTAGKQAFLDVPGRTNRPYDAGNRAHRHMTGWIPRVGGVDREYLGSRDTIVGRARDLERNNPIISGGLDRRAEAVVGSRIRLQAMPDFEAMGRDWEWAAKWARQVESQFRVWDRDSRRLCDAERAQTFGQLVETAYRHWERDGEALAYIEMRDRGSAYRTCIRLIDPDRLQNPDGMQDGTTLPNGRQVVGGVEMDASGVAVAYHVRVKHPDDAVISATRNETVRIAREDPDGRPRVVHAFRRKRAQQRRGISRLVASMRKIRMLDKYDDAELELAILRALRAPYVKMSVPTDEVREALAPAGDQQTAFIDEYLDYREENPLFVEGISFTQTFPGEEIGFAQADGPPAHYAEFRAEGLRSIASDFGLSHQQLAQNWTEINYSSARTLLNEIWRSLLDDRWQFTQMFCTPIYAAWLQEAVAIGKVKLPGGPVNFYRYRAEITMADWLGPGRGRIDPLKEAKASDANLASFRSNLALEANEQGLDSRDILMGAARDNSMLEEFGLERKLPDSTAQGAPAEGARGDG